MRPDDATFDTELLGKCVAIVKPLHYEMLRIAREVATPRIAELETSVAKLATGTATIVTPYGEMKVCFEPSDAVPPTQGEEPGPSAWAYEQACRALEEQRARAEAAEKRVAELLCDVKVHEAFRVRAKRDAAQADLARLQAGVEQMASRLGARSSSSDVWALCDAKVAEELRALLTPSAKPPARAGAAIGDVSPAWQQPTRDVLPPEVLADALQDRIHATSGRLLSASPVLTPAPDASAKAGPAMPDLSVSTFASCEPSSDEDANQVVGRLLDQGLAGTRIESVPLACWTKALGILAKRPAPERVTREALAAVIDNNFSCGLCPVELGHAADAAAKLLGVTLASEESAPVSEEPTPDVVYAEGEAPTTLAELAEVWRAEAACERTDGDPESAGWADVRDECAAELEAFLAKLLADDEPPEIQVSQDWRYWRREYQAMFDQEQLCRDTLCAVSRGLGIPPTFTSKLGELPVEAERLRGERDRLRAELEALTAAARQVTDLQGYTGSHADEAVGRLRDLVGAPLITLYDDGKAVKTLRTQEEVDAQFGVGRFPGLIDRMPRVAVFKAAPIPMLLTCPACCARHIDEGEFATKKHHTHSCQKCGHTWRPALVDTVGVQFLPGFKNVEAPARKRQCKFGGADRPGCAGCDDSFDACALALGGR